MFCTSHIRYYKARYQEGAQTNSLRAVPRNDRRSNYKKSPKSPNKKVKHIIKTEESKSSADESNPMNPGPARTRVHPFSQNFFYGFPFSLERLYF